MTITKIAMIVLFVYSAWIQRNDPDPWLWIALYLLPAYATWTTLRKRSNLTFTLALPLVILACAFTVRVVGVEAWHVDDERFREAGGLGIAAAWLAWLWFNRRS